MFESLASDVMSDITELLNDDTPGADQRLLEAIYEELRRLASAKMANEHSQTLAATGLVHEAWLRLAGPDARWQSRSHFFAAASEAMRRILIERARRRNSLKRGGQFQQADLDLAAIEHSAPDQRLLQLDEALQDFEDLDPVKASLVKLRFFAGCTSEEAAQLLEISTATAERYWAYARAWLQTAMAGDSD